jgi:hypothetical protein
MVCIKFQEMTKQLKMTLDEARAILHRWDKRKAGERELVLAANRLLAEAWEARRKEEGKKRRPGIL